MNDKELWELMSIICEGQDSEQRRKAEQYITDLQKESERLNNIINELEQWLYDNTNYEEYDRVEKDTFNYVIKKIEELKGEKVI